MNSMIAIFQPVNNWPWFDIREFKIKDWKPSTYRWLKVEDYIDCLLELPIYKPKVACKDKQEYFEQFLDKEYT